MHVLIALVGVDDVDVIGVDCVFFFKQKTAYELLRSLVGSEMCIRDSSLVILEIERAFRQPVQFKGREFVRVGSYKKPLKAVSYTNLTLPTIYSV